MRLLPVRVLQLHPMHPPKPQPIRSSKRKLARDAGGSLAERPQHGQRAAGVEVVEGGHLGRDGRRDEALHPQRAVRRSDVDVAAQRPELIGIEELAAQC